MGFLFCVFPDKGLDVKGRAVESGHSARRGHKILRELVDAAPMFDPCSMGDGTRVFPDPIGDMDHHLKLSDRGFKVGFTAVGKALSPGCQGMYPRLRELRMSSSSRKVVVVRKMCARSAVSVDMPLGQEPVIYAPAWRGCG